MPQRASQKAPAPHHGGHRSFTLILHPSSFRCGPSITTRYAFGLYKQEGAISRRFYSLAGQELDDTGLLFYHARYYDPGMGRFISADSIVPGAGALTVTPSDAVATKAWGERGAAANPQELNRYSYVNNNPLGAGDPTGHVGEHDPCRKGCAGTTGGGGGGGAVGRVAMVAVGRRHPLQRQWQWQWQWQWAD